MKPEYRAPGKRVLILGLFVCMALVIGGLLRIVFDPHLVSRLSVAAPKPIPPLSPAVSIFSCINSSDVMNDTGRVVVLHGPDWILDSTVEPSCFPEREVVFSAEVGRQFLRHPVTVRTKLWVTKVREVVFVKIVDSSGNDKQDMIAVGLVTNHKCTGRTSRSCIVMGGAAPMTM
jgi:hypothetical protein